MTEITELRPNDRARWGELWLGYLTFYKTSEKPEVYDQLWHRIQTGNGIHAFAARRDGRLIGIAHYLFHANVRGADACYLNDLYVDETVRGSGAGRKLIEAIAEVARGRGCSRYYWSTQETNSVARTLYDKVAQFNGFIRYDYPLNQGA